MKQGRERGAKQNITQVQRNGHSLLKTFMQIFFPGLERGHAMLPGDMVAVLSR